MKENERVSAKKTRPRTHRSPLILSRLLARQPPGTALRHFICFTLVRVALTPELTFQQDENALCALASASNEQLASYQSLPKWRGGFF
jgi:hypothetical protein